MCFRLTYSVDITHSQFITWKGDEVAQSAEDFLLYHKFGHVSIIRSHYILNEIHIMTS